MFTITEEAVAEIEEKRSRFISYLVPITCFEARLEELRAEHKKANHHVWAFRRLNAYEQIEEGSTDDGEPSGTSGAPSLRVLQGAELIEAAVITVRYFGGTKLGTGGLVRAYGEGVKAVLATADLKPYVKLHSEQVSVPFKDIAQAEYLCAQHEVKVRDRSFGAEGAVFLLEGTEEAVKAVIGILNPY